MFEYQQVPNLLPKLTWGFWSNPVVLSQFLAVLHKKLHISSRKDSAFKVGFKYQASWNQHPKTNVKSILLEPKWYPSRVSKCFKLTCNHTRFRVHTRFF